MAKTMKMYALPWLSGERDIERDGAFMLFASKGTPQHLVDAGFLRQDDLKKLRAVTVTIEEKRHNVRQ